MTTTCGVLRLNPTYGQRPTDPSPAAAETPGRASSSRSRPAAGRSDEFVEKFAAYAWEGSLVLPAATALPVGTQGRFVILLRDQTIAMRGRCRVTEAKQARVSSRNPAVKRIHDARRAAGDGHLRAARPRPIALRSAPVPLPVPSEPSETTQVEPAKHERPGAAPRLPARTVRDRAARQDAAAGSATRESEHHQRVPRAGWEGRFFRGPRRPARRPLQQRPESDLDDVHRPGRDGDRIADVDGDRIGRT